MTTRDDGVRVLDVESDQTLTGCPDCGVVPVGHGRRIQVLHDAPCLPAVRVRWFKRIWRCREPACPRATWTEDHSFAPPRAKLTARAVAWAVDAARRHHRVRDRPPSGFVPLLGRPERFGLLLLALATDLYSRPVGAEGGHRRVHARGDVGPGLHRPSLPLRMLPVVLFEVAWKLTWLGVIALPLWLDDKLDGATREQAGALLWVVIIIAAIPWRHVLAQYVLAPGEPRRRRR